MSREKFDDNCPGCRPVIVDPETLKAFADDHPVMQHMRLVWQNSTFAQREAFHNVMCLNSRDPDELALVKQLTDQLR